MEPDKKKKVLLIAGVVAVLIVLFLAFLGVVFWFVWSWTGEPVKVVRAHLEAINQGDYERAYSYISASAKQDLSLQDFRTFVDENPAVMKTSDTTFSSRKIENNVATIRGTHTGRNGEVTPVRYTLVKEGERWVISGFRYGSAATADEDD